MELRHLRTIVAVARHRSFTKAGEELYLAQSAISQQIRRLERELGLEVFRRTSRSVELTAEGRVILGYAQRVLAEVDGLHSELEELTGLLSGQLRIGGVYPTGPYDLFSMLADFREAHPGVAIHMVEDTQEGVLEAPDLLRDRRLGEVQLLGGLRERAVAGDGGDRAKVAELHAKHRASRPARSRSHVPVASDKAR